MNALVSSPQEPSPSARPGGPLLRTLVLCDLADSTALIERLGDQRAATLIRKHDRLARDLVQRHVGQEIDKTDGFLVLFVRPIEGIAFALDYQRELRQLGQSEQLDLRARVGVHVGDVVVWENSAADVAHGAKPVEVEGLVKPVAARLANLALPGQILASGVAANLSQRAHGELGDKEKTALWLNHGRYRFKGVPEPLPVYEIGEPGIAPLSAPPWSSKAHREVPWWRRPATVAVEATLLLGCIAASAWWLLRPPPALAFAERDWVVVGSLKNLTGGAAFDDAVDTAFRLGLEQSRYVNVLSDLKVRETLGLMQRDPDKTAVDRAIGSEVALRDGARALILPTIAEIGGKVRITAEVIDPQTQATVYSESADGSGASSVLPSIDKVNAKLRERLGEALASVSSESKPLERVSTSNLDALRAYSLGERAYSVANNAEALRLYGEALRIDPSFALAHLATGRILVGKGDSEAAAVEFRSALANSDRLTTRDRSYIDAWLATMDSPRLALNKWSLLFKLYPDFFPARGMHAYVAWQGANQYDEAIASAEVSASSKNPNAVLIHYLLGVLYLGQERYTDAQKEFAIAKQGGYKDENFLAALRATQRRYAEIPAKRGSNGGLGVSLMDAAIDVDQGKTLEVGKRLESLANDPGLANASSLHQVQGIIISLAVLSEQPVEQIERSAREYLSKITKENSGNQTEAAERAFQILVAGYFAAQIGKTTLLESALGAVPAIYSTADYPVVAQMRVTIQAERELLAGRPAAAIRLLETERQGSQLLVTHHTLLKAYKSAGDTKAALSEASWIATHRGRAFSEYNCDWMLRPWNVAQSNLALLSQAELYFSLRQRREAKSALDTFLGIWKPTEGSPVAARVRALQDALPAG